jgi:hypothetical protein
MYRNMATVGGMFILTVFILSEFSSVLFPSSFFPMLVGDVLALGAAYYFFTIWEKRPIRVRCEHCEHIISSATPWVCGVCKNSNTDADAHPFVHKCGNVSCGAIPKTYRCHHCNGFIFLSDDEDTLTYAYRLNSPAEMPGPDKRVEKIKKRKERTEDLDDLRELALARERLMIVQRRLKGEKKLTVSERLRVNTDKKVELDEAALLLKAENAEKCKGDEARLERLNAAVDAAVQSELAGNE